MPITGLPALLLLEECRVAHIAQLYCMYVFFKWWHLVFAETQCFCIWRVDC